MRGFLIGSGFFVGWWILMVLVFKIVALIIAAIVGAVPEALHAVLWLIYISAVVIGGTCVVVQKDAILATLRRAWPHSE